MCVVCGVVYICVCAHMWRSENSFVQFLCVACVCVCRCGIEEFRKQGLLSKTGPWKSDTHLSVPRINEKIPEPRGSHQDTLCPMYVSAVP